MSVYNELVNTTANAGVAKVSLLKEKPAQYLLLSAMAGFFVGLGIFLLLTVGGQLAGTPAVKIGIGISFGIALSLVIMVGSELFTGNNYILTISALEKKVSWLDALYIWAASYIGNFAGSVFAAWLFVSAGLAKGKTAAFVLKVAEAKMTMPANELFFRGILCNILVCLAVLTALKMKSESGKLIMIFWCLYAFITCGYEHSIANMTLLSVALLIEHVQTISVGGLFNNLVFVTLGNFVGGAVFLGLGYWFIGKNAKTV